MRTAILALVVVATLQPATEVRRLTAKTLRVYSAPDAEQGVAADGRYFYAISNSMIAKHEISGGRQVQRWSGAATNLIHHLNSCYANAGRLWCANSNYPETPMGSSIEVFDSAMLDHIESRSLGALDEGSLTWFAPYAGGFIAGFAHYDGNGGVGFKNHRYSSVVTFDAEWRRNGGWLFPATIESRMAPFAASGGAIGPDGWLYLMGHDRPEMYVVGRPSMGPVLIHLATIDLEAEGQAFSWAQDGTRTVFTIDRRKRLVRSISIPVLRDTPAAKPFR